jgi:hypothetical protein
LECRRAIQGVDVFCSLGEFHGERSGAAADIEHPVAGPRQVPQDQAMIEGVVIPVQTVHAFRLCWLGM